MILKLSLRYEQIIGNFIIHHEKSTIRHAKLKKLLRIFGLSNRIAELLFKIQSGNMPSLMIHEICGRKYWTLCIVMLAATGIFCMVTKNICVFCILLRSLIKFIVLLKSDIEKVSAVASIYSFLINVQNELPVVSIIRSLFNI